MQKEDFVKVGIFYFATVIFFIIIVAFQDGNLESRLSDKITALESSIKELQSGEVSPQYLQGVKAGMQEGITQTQTSLKSEIEKNKKEGVCTPSESGKFYIEL